MLCLQFFRLSLSFFEKFLHFNSALGTEKSKTDIGGNCIQKFKLMRQIFVHRSQFDHSKWKIIARDRHCYNVFWFGISGGETYCEVVIRNILNQNMFFGTESFPGNTFTNLQLFFTVLICQSVTSGKMQTVIFTLKINSSYGTFCAFSKLIQNIRGEFFNGFVAHHFPVKLRN